MPVRTVPVAASSAVAAVLGGPPREVRVAAALPTAIHLATGDPRCPVLCLCTPGAVRLPFALVGAVSLNGVVVDDVGSAGGGTLTVGRVTVRVSRWWRPPRPRGLAAAGGDRLRGALTALRAAVPDPFPDEQARLVRALRGPTGPGLAAAVCALLGRGPGLTPLGDDVLAGALVTLAALNAPECDRLAAVVDAAVGNAAVVDGAVVDGAVVDRAVVDRAVVDGAVVDGAVVDGAAPAATTSVSAALLHHAARGECVPQLDALLTAVRVGPPSALDPALAGVLAVGHTSGTGLVAGILVALATVTGGPG